MSEHLLNGSEVSASLEQVGREGVAEDVGVDPGRVEASFLGQPAQDQEGAGARQGPAAGVQEQLGAMPPVEVGAAP